MDFISVKFNEEERIGTVELNRFPFFTSCGCVSVKDFKKKFIEWISNEFDNAISQDLGINFPYVIGGMTFYTISEIERYIEGTQRQKKE